ncbi:MAG TPA: hypothetical protein VK509_09410, partial [Polyangiales bacterium]|nr:hypothetical protein [Polyangiales bacterium]
MKKTDQDNEAFPAEDTLPAIAAPTPASKATVDVHMARLGGDLWKHAAAAALHGWAEHAHHEGKPMELSADDYAAALKAAEGPNAEGEYVPHAP